MTRFAVRENKLAGYGDNGANFFIVDAETSRQIAEMSLEHQLVDEGETAEYLAYRAWAYVMAASLDLLEAAQQAKTYLNDGGSPKAKFEAYLALDAAIAKAYGGVK